MIFITFELINIYTLESVKLVALDKIFLHRQTYGHTDGKLI